MRGITSDNSPGRYVLDNDGTGCNYSTFPNFDASQDYGVQAHP